MPDFILFGTYFVRVVSHPWCLGAPPVWAAQRGLFSLILMVLYTEWILPPTQTYAWFHPLVWFFIHQTTHVHEQMLTIFAQNISPQTCSLIIAKHIHMSPPESRHVWAKLYSVNPFFLSGVTQACSQTQSELGPQYLHKTFHHRLVIKLYMCTCSQYLLKT